MKKYTPSYRQVDMGEGMGSVQVFMDDVPKWLEGFEEEYVPAQLAEEMLEVLKSLVQWDETDQHSDDDMIAVGKFESIINQAKSLIKKAEEV